MKKVTLAEAYEMAVSAIPGHATTQAWNLCRDEMLSNLAVVFEHGGKPVETMRYNPVDSVGKGGEYAVEKLGKSV